MNLFDKLDYSNDLNNVSLYGMTDDFFCLYISNLSKVNNKNQKY